MTDDRKQKKTALEKAVPQHIAIIMDGNGRWAKSRNLPRIAGHRKGAQVVKEIVRECSDLGVKFLTLYTFSTENWKRPRHEVDFLMQLLSSFLKKEIRKLLRNNVRFLTIGDIEALPPKARQVIQEAKDTTAENSGLTLILALNYGGRKELLRAARLFSEDVKKGRRIPKEINEDLFADYLYTAGIPDPELLIRTSGEMRISNFLLWQLSYSEFFVTDVFWPDFNAGELDKAIREFGRRKRRFGGI